MSYKRQICQQPAICQPLKGIPDMGDVKSWLVDQAKTYKMASPCYLLAHANDGVIWGRLDKNGALLTSYDALAEKTGLAIKLALPQLRTETLQQARLFNEEAELYIWVDGEGEWNGRYIKDTPEQEGATWYEYFDEPQLLWGTPYREEVAHNFTLLEDGAQGLYHAVPVYDPATHEEKRFYLQVRHYLNQDGFTQVDASRLVALL